MLGSDRIDIVAFWKQNDSGIYGRRQDMLVKQFVRDPRVNHVVHFDAPIARRRLRALLDAADADGRMTQDGLVYAQTMARHLRLADTPKVTRRVLIHDSSGRSRLFPGEDAYIDFVGGVLAEAGIGSRPTVFFVWPTHFPFPRLVEAFAPDLVVADVVDDHRRWPASSEQHARIERHYRDVIAASDLVIANCEPVKQAMEALGAEVRLLPNALELPEHADSPEAPPDMLGIASPIVGYVGNLDDLRLDLELLERIAETKPAWNLVLIGSLHRGDKVQRLRRFPNIHLLGVKRYEDALRCIRRFDVALIPHRRNDLTEVMNPLKAYVYVSLGVPVVSTDIANLGDLRAYIAVAQDHESCIRAIDERLAHRSRLPVEDRRRLLREHSWEERVDRLMDWVEASWARRWAALGASPFLSESTAN